MLAQFQDYLTFKNIFLYVNFGIIPFWLMLIFIPASKFTKIIVNSVIIPLILASTYVYVIYKAFLLEESFLQLFQLYLDMDNLYALFSVESFLLIFWLHFLSINLFVGNWIANDSKIFNVSKLFVILSLLMTYFTGPVGLVFYWFVRIFYSKKINFYD